MNKSILYVLILIMALALGMGAACASENLDTPASVGESPMEVENGEALSSNEGNALEESSESEEKSSNDPPDSKLSAPQNSQTLSANEGTFSELQELIDNSQGSTIILNKSYAFNKDFNPDGISITKSVTIDGNNNVLDGKNLGRIFNIKAPNVILKNIKFINGYTSSNGGAINFYQTDWILQNCIFINNLALGGGAIYSLRSNGKIFDSKFIGNNASNDGGAIEFQINYGDDVVVLEITGSEFDGNNARYGAAIKSSRFNAPKFSSRTVISISDSVFNNNHAVRGAFYLVSSAEIINSTFNNNSNSAIDTLDNLTVIDCKFENNAGSMGGAICAWNGNPIERIINSTFINNSARMTGGAIMSSTNTAILDCKFINNSAVERGGAVDMIGDNCIISNSSFDGNAVVYHAGAVYVQDGYCTISYCNFTNNRQKNDGANKYRTDGGAVAWAGYHGLITDCNFINNSAEDDGGAVAWYRQGGVLKNSNFIDNTAGTDGGAVSFDYNCANAEIFNCSFNNNHAIRNGGAIFYNYYYNTDLLKGIFVDNCDFSDNGADYGGAIYARYLNLSDSEFTFNKAKQGSAIYSYYGHANISDSKFLDNQAWGNRINVIASTSGKDVLIDSTLYGYDNVLNAIYSYLNARIDVKNVTYWGADGVMKTPDEWITPVLDSRESGQNVTVEIYNDQNMILNFTGTTDENGLLSLDLKSLPKGDYSVKSYNKENTYYTSVLGTGKFSITFDSAPSSVSADSVIVTYGESIVVNVVSVNATAVNYEVVDENNVVVAGGTLKPGEAITGLDLAVGGYTVNLVTVVDDYHSFATNSSSITVIPAPSAVSADSVIVTYGEGIVVNVVSVNATAVNYEVVDENNVVVASGTLKPGEAISGLDLAAGVYTVNLVTVVDDNHHYVLGTSAIIVNKAPSVVSADSVIVTYGESIVVNVVSVNATAVNYDVVDENNVVVASGTLKPGEAISGLDLGVGGYTVNLVTVVDGNHHSVTNSSSITVEEKVVLADLSVVKVLNKDTYGVGDIVYVTVTVTNHGPHHAENVVVFLNIHEELEFDSSSAPRPLTSGLLMAPNDHSYDHDTGLWTIGDLANGASTQLHLTLQTTTHGDYDLHSQVSSSTLDHNMDNNAHKVSLSVLKGNESNNESGDDPINNESDDDPVNNESGDDPVNNETGGSENNNSTDDIIDDNVDNIGDGDNSESSDSSSVHKSSLDSNATGNPLLLLLMVIAILGIGVRRRDY